MDGKVCVIGKRVITVLSPFFLDWLACYSTVPVEVKSRNVKRNIYLHRPASFSSETTWSQPLGEAATEPHHHYGHEIRCQSTRQRYFLSARAIVHAGCAIVVVDICLLLYVLPGRHDFRMIDGRRLFRCFWRWRFRFVARAFLETILVVRDRILIRTVPGSTSRTVPLGVFWKLDCHPVTVSWLVHSEYGMVAMERRGFLFGNVLQVFLDDGLDRSIGGFKRCGAVSRRV